MSELGVRDANGKIARLEAENYQLRLKIRTLERRVASNADRPNPSISENDGRHAAQIQELERQLERERAKREALQQDLSKQEEVFMGKLERDMQRVHAHYQIQVDEYRKQQQHHQAPPPPPAAAPNVSVLKDQVKHYQKAVFELEQVNDDLKNQQQQQQQRQGQADDTLQKRLEAVETARREAEAKVHNLQAEVAELQRNESAVAPLQRQLATMEDKLRLAHEAQARAEVELAELKSDKLSIPRLRIVELEAEAQAAVTRATVADTRIQNLEGELRQRQVNHELVEGELRNLKARVATAEAMTGSARGGGLGAGLGGIAAHTRLTAQLRDHKTKIVQLEHDKEKLEADNVLNLLAIQSLQRQKAELETTLQRLDMPTNSAKHARELAGLQQQATEANYLDVERLQEQRVSPGRSVAERLGL